MIDLSGVHQGFRCAEQFLYLKQITISEDRLQRRNPSIRAVHKYAIEPGLVGDLDDQQKFGDQTGAPVFPPSNLFSRLIQTGTCYRGQERADIPGLFRN